MSAQPAGVVLSILCPDDDLQGFCRRLASSVSQGPMHLATVVATGSQIYPTRADTLRGTATLLRCEFRMRNATSTITDQHFRNLLDRVAPRPVLDSFFVDGNGTHLTQADDLAAAS